MRPNIVTICYIDSDGQHKFTKCNEDKYFSNSVFNICQYKTDHPDMYITAVFYQNNNIITANEREKDSFHANCYSYGFEPSDYKRLIVDSNGIKYYFIGFLPQNHKYKASILRISDNCKRKASLRFVQKYIVR